MVRARHCQSEGLISNGLRNNFCNDHPFVLLLLTTTTWSKGCTGDYLLLASVSFDVLYQKFDRNEMLHQSQCISRKEPVTPLGGGGGEVGGVRYFLFHAITPCFRSLFVDSKFLKINIFTNVTNLQFHSLQFFNQ